MVSSLIWTSAFAQEWRFADSEAGKRVSLIVRLDGRRADGTTMDGNPLTSRLDSDAIFAAFHRDSAHPQRTPFIAAKHPALAQQVVKLLRNG